MLRHTDWIQLTPSPYYGFVVCLQYTSEPTHSWSSFEWRLVDAVSPGRLITRYSVAWPWDGFWCSAAVPQREKLRTVSLLCVQRRHEHLVSHWITDRQCLLLALRAGRDSKDICQADRKPCFIRCSRSPNKGRFIRSSFRSLWTVSNVGA